MRLDRIAEGITGQRGPDSNLHAKIEPAGGDSALKEPRQPLSQLLLPPTVRKVPDMCNESFKPHTWATCYFSIVVH